MSTFEKGTHTFLQMSVFITFGGTDKIIPSKSFRPLQKLKLGLMLSLAAVKT